MVRLLTTVACLTTLGLANAQWLDPTFGTGGLVATSLNAGYDGAFSTLVQPDGKIVVAGSIAGNGGYDFLVARYLADGQLDPAFGTGGFSTHHERAQDFGRDVALQADGGLVVVGTSSGGGTDKVVMRFTADGDLDPSFGNAGVVIIDDSAVDDALWAVAVQPDQRIVIVGQGFNGTLRTFYIARLNTNGSFDPTFGNSGEYEHLIGNDFCWAQDVALMDDGRIVVVGTTHTTGISAHDAAVVRYMPDGSFDPSFGDGGKVVIPWSVESDVANALAVYPDGRVLVGGSSSLTDTHIAASRLLADGTLDPDFGANGTVLTYAGVSPTRCGGIALDAEDRILLAGTAAQDGTQRSSYLCRLTSDGVLDPSFGNSGELINGTPGVYEETPAMALQADGKIVLAGITGAGTAIDVRLIRYTDAAITSVRPLDGSFDMLHADDGELELRSLNTGMVDYRIITSSGQLLQHGSVFTTSGARERITFEDRPSPGLHFITITSAYGSWTAKFMVQH
ncbi:MAG: delta-60 repeat domain-containing protein [Flavobacteriales bacterium]